MQYHNGYNMIYIYTQIYFSFYNKLKHPSDKTDILSQNIQIQIDLGVLLRYMYVQYYDF